MFMGVEHKNAVFQELSESMKKPVPCLEHSSSYSIRVKTEVLIKYTKEKKIL